MKPMNLSSNKKISNSEYPYVFNSNELKVNSLEEDESVILIQSIHEQLNELMMASVRRRFLYKEISNYLK